MSGFKFRHRLVEPGRLPESRNACNGHSSRYVWAFQTTKTDFLFARNQIFISVIIVTYPPIRPKYSILGASPKNTSSALSRAVHGTSSSRSATRVRCIRALTTPKGRIWSSSPRSCRSANSGAYSRPPRTRGNARLGLATGHRARDRHVGVARSAFAPWTGRPRGLLQGRVVCGSAADAHAPHSWLSLFGMSLERAADIRHPVYGRRAGMVRAGLWWSMLDMGPCSMWTSSGGGCWCKESALPQRPLENRRRCRRPWPTIPGGRGMIDVDFLSSSFSCLPYLHANIP